jgi:hypothetical protein
MLFVTLTRKAITSGWYEQSHWNGLVGPDGPTIYKLLYQ